MAEIPDWLDNIDESIEQAQEAEYLNDVANGIKEYYMWPLVALGLPGNLLTIITLVTMGKMTPGAFFIAMLAASDLAALLTKFIVLQLNIRDVHQGSFGCKMHFLPIYFSTLANWTLVLIAFERYISVCYPLQKAYLFTKRRSYIAAIVLIVSFLLLLAPLFGVLYTSYSDGYSCSVHKRYEFFWENVWNWINACLVMFIPFILCMILTILIIRGLRKSRRDRLTILRKGEDGSSSANNNSKLIKETEKVERMLTIMLILTTIVFLVLALPACIFFLAKKKSYDNDAEIARWNLFRQIQYMLFNTAHAINFFIYFLSARRFRTHFISILTCKKTLVQKHSETSNQTDSSMVSASIQNK